MIERRRRLIATLIVLLLALGGVAYDGWFNNPAPLPAIDDNQPTSTTLATEALGQLAIKGRAPKTGYSRGQFGGSWQTVAGCDVRERILQRDLTSVVLSDDNCTVVSATLTDPYTGKTIQFQRGAGSSAAVQIDHVVALSDAWQKGAEQLSFHKRQRLANNPLNLLAVDGPTNIQKGDGDAATWLPPNKTYRCRYIARQIAVKLRYKLWVTAAEHDAMARILQTCPDQHLPAVSR